jgi:hypothetical protein
MVGRDTLLDVSRNTLKGDQVDISPFAALEGPERYFKNRLGGLGQYYFGPLRDLRILDYVDNNPQNPPGYDKDLGLAIAEIFEDGVGGGDAFFEAIEKKKIAKRELEGLAGFCPCFLRSHNAERNLLLDILLGRREADEPAAAVRRKNSLLLLLNLIRDSPEPTDLGLEGVLRGAAYTGMFQDGTEWKVPESLLRTRMAWGTYQRGELLSVAVQGIFWSILNTIALEHHGRASSAEEIGKIGQELARRVLGDRADKRSVLDEVENVASTLPAHSQWDMPNHELQLAWRLEEKARHKNPSIEDVSAVFNYSLKLMLALLARNPAKDPYSMYDEDPSSSTDEDINLRSFAHRSVAWSGLTVSTWADWLSTRWGVLRHLQVALRKLRIENRDTFRIRPLDGELRLVEVPRPVFTLPRLSCTRQILRDLGLIEVTNDGWWSLTKLGLKNLEESVGG